MTSPEERERERERYRRQMMIPGFGEDAQERLSRSTALVAGVGGLGGTVALYLAAAGIGRLILYHDGTLTRSNLNRQILMRDDGVGELRVEMARESLLRFNPQVEVEIREARVTAPTLEADLGRCQVAVDARHNFPERRHLSRAAREKGVPLVEAAMYNMEATLTVLHPPSTPCLDCLYPEDPEWDYLGFPVLGAVSGALGCLAAIEAVKVLTGFGHPLKGEMLYMDLERASFDRLPVPGGEACPTCAGLVLSR